jgi:hypothetical protein
MLFFVHQNESQTTLVECAIAKAILDAWSARNLDPNPKQRTAGWILLEMLQLPLRVYQGAVLQFLEDALHKMLLIIVRYHDMASANVYPSMNARN